MEPELGRSARKRQAIIDAARTVFLKHGYAGASMDEVAAIAAVSKQTVYKNFADKETLFTEIIIGDIGEAERQTGDIADVLPDTDDFEPALKRFARQHIVEVLQPHLIQLRRVVMAEADRFPEVAKTWYATAPERAHAILAERFAELSRKGRLKTPEPLLAAQHFNYLVLSIPLNQAMFRPSDLPFSPKELHRYADEGVRVFLAAYGP